MTTEEKAELRSRIEEAVCPICVNYTLDGECDNHAFDDCPIDLFFDGLVEMIIESGHMPRMEDYYADFQQKICPSCGKKKPDGRCKPREDGDCSVYTYLPTIVKVVEEYFEAKNATDCSQARR
jgi:hypothetical protein